ncbi:anti-phage defense ZorAB system ZorA [Planctomonas sp. JC2975]|nr:anti-phage defense ZorAB system ZorA [Planctomonas sp. JC2975]
MYLVRYWRAFEFRANALASLIQMPETANLAQYRPLMLQRAEALDPKVLGPLWKEFDETLVATRDGNQLFNTVDAEYFFNRETLAVEFARNRLLAALPGMLATGGVLGTFLTLSIGLSGLDISGATSDSDALGDGVQNLIGAAGFAFAKSVVGVGLSLLFTIVDRVFERRVATRVAPIQAQIDHLYRRTTPERSLVEVADYTRESKEALQELHEKIGDRLQEAIQGISTDLQGALTSAITTAMQPSMEKLVDTTSGQSAAVFEGLVERFASAFTDIGERQSAMLDSSSTRLTAAIDRVGVEFGDLVEQSRRHADDVHQRQAELLEGLGTTVTGLTTSSADLAEAAREISVLSEKIAAAGGQLGTGLTQTAATLMSLYEKSVRQAQIVSDLQERATATEANLDEAASRVSDATSALGAALDGFSSTQQNFQASLRGEAEDLASTLRTYVEELESKVGTWLTDYSSDIEHQINDRMQLWNAHSQDYAAHMLATSKALAGVIDELHREGTSPVDDQTIDRSVIADELEIVS